MFSLNIYDIRLDTSFFLFFIVDRGHPRKKLNPGVIRNPTDLDVVLEAFQEFVTQYK